VTGAYLAFPYAPMARAVREILPKARRIGTLFAPGEVNSTLARSRFEEALRGEGLELVAVPVNGPAEVADGALNLCQSGVDVVCQISDNLSNSTFPAIAHACEAAKIPLFSFSPELVKRGAVLGLGTDFTENGRDAGRLAAAVIRGEDPAKIPFRATSKVTRTIDLERARRLGLTVPAGWPSTAVDVTPARAGSP
jgi:putative ABC transport system permease protein